MYRVRGQFIVYDCNETILDYASRAMNCALDTIHLVPTTLGRQKII